jgi:hypothetical protein
MLSDADRQEIAALIEQSKIATGVGIGVLLLLNIPYGGGGSVGFLSAAIGVSVGGWMMTRPEAAPLSITPRAPGFTQEVAREEQFLERMKPTLTRFRQAHQPKIRRIIGSEIGLLALCSLLYFAFSPVWPGNGDLFVGGVFLFIAFLFGAILAAATCWLSIYRTVLHTMS